MKKLLALFLAALLGTAFCVAAAGETADPILSGQEAAAMISENRWQGRDIHLNRAGIRLWLPDGCSARPYLNKDALLGENCTLYSLSTAYQQNGFVIWVEDVTGRFPGCTGFEQYCSAVTGRSVGNILRTDINGIPAIVYDASEPFTMIGGERRGFRCYDLAVGNRIIELQALAAEGYASKLQAAIGTVQLLPAGNQSAPAVQSKNWAGTDADGDFFVIAGKWQLWLPGTVNANKQLTRDIVINGTPLFFSAAGAEGGRVKLYASGMTREAVTETLLGEAVDLEICSFNGIPGLQYGIPSYIGENTADEIHCLLFPGDGQVLDLTFYPYGISDEGIIGADGFRTVVASIQEVK